jgi:K+/H+ antiporter YhaU regulatory subunit KhtT
LEVVYDSITSPQPEADVEEGWHLLFIGDPGEMLTVTAS